MGHGWLRFDSHCQLRARIRNGEKIRGRGGRRRFGWVAHLWLRDSGGRPSSRELPSTWTFAAEGQRVDSYFEHCGGDGFSPALLFRAREFISNPKWAFDFVAPRHYCAHVASSTAQALAALGRVESVCLSQRKW